MATKESIEAAIAGLPADDFWHLLLTFLRDNPSQSVPMEGPVYEAYQRQIGGKFGSVRSYRTAITSKCRDKYGVPPRDIQSMFKPAPTETREEACAHLGTFKLDVKSASPLELDPSKYDPEYYEILSKMTIYSDTKLTPYASIAIYMPEYDIHQYYPIYRYVAGLPYYTKLDCKRLLATVDHISRDHTDDQHTNLRYVTRYQNCLNAEHRGRSTEVPYHGLRDQNAYVKVNAGKHGKQSTIDKIQVWCKVFDHYVNKYADRLRKEPTGLLHISLTECGEKAKKRLDEWRPYAWLMDTFIDEMLDFLEEEDKTDYNVHGMLCASLPELDTEVYPLLSKLRRKCAGEVCATKQFHKHFIAALTYDINKRHICGEFSIGNFLKPITEGVTNVAAPQRPVKTPADILNEFEDDLVDDVLNTMYEKLGIPEKNKVREYSMVSKDGSLEVHAMFRDRKTDYKSKLVAVGVDSPKLRLTSPYMVYEL